MYAAIEQAKEVASAQLIGFDQAVKRVEERRRSDRAFELLKASIDPDDIICTWLEAWLLGLL